MTLNQIYENIKKTQYDRNLSFYKKFYPSILDSESQFFYFYITKLVWYYIMEIIEDHYLH